MNPPFENTPPRRSRRGAPAAALRSGWPPDQPPSFAAPEALDPFDPLFAWGRLLPKRSTPDARPARQIRSRRNRERLIAAVECVIRELGPSGATVRRIAARAGVSVGTVYRRFPNKAALMRAVQRRFLLRREERVGLALRLGHDPDRSRPRRVRGFARRLIMDAERDREMTRAFGRVPCPDGELPARVAPFLPEPALHGGLAGELLVLLVRAVLSGPVPVAGGPSATPSPALRSPSTSPSRRTS